MERESSYGLTRVPMMVTSSKIISTAKESTSGLTVEFITDNGSTIKWKVKEHSLGVMVGDMSASIRMIKSMAKELLNGLMVESISENGAKESSMAEEPT